jgi:aryl-alcohol dehydrogenase-like predicted oxidoreductase
LSGKYTRDLDGPPAGARADDEEWAGRNSDRTWRVIETVQAVAAEVDRTPAQVALRWVLQQPGLTGPIIGARTPEQLADNLGATGWALDDDQLRRLTETGDQLLPYPYQLQRLPQFVRRPT